MQLRNCPDCNGRPACIAEYRQMMDVAMARMYTKWPVVKPPEVVPTTMGERIRARREKMKFSKDGFSDMVSADEKTLQKWENNTLMPSISRIYTIADTLETTAEYLYGGPIESLYRHMGDRIRHMREDSGMTQRELAEMLGHTQKRQTDIERGRTKPKKEELPQIASILETTMEWLRGEE